MKKNAQIVAHSAISAPTASCSSGESSRPRFSQVRSRGEEHPLLVRGGDDDSGLRLGSGHVRRRLYAQGQLVDQREHLSRISSLMISAGLTAIVPKSLWTTS